MPYAISLGALPIDTMAASIPLPAGVPESEYVGAICGSPLEVVKCETNDMYVPATSEIVPEGTISITDTNKEGHLERYTATALLMRTLSNLCIKSKPSHIVTTQSYQSVYRDAQTSAQMRDTR